MRGQGKQRSFQVLGECAVRTHQPDGILTEAAPHQSCRALDRRCGGRRVITGALIDLDQALRRRGPTQLGTSIPDRLDVLSACVRVADQLERSIGAGSSIPGD